MCKKASIVEYEIVDENLVKLVVRREGFPGAAFDFHPGSYIWLSVDVPADKRSEYMRDDIVGPPAFPVNVPSWVWFHPITVSSFDPEVLTSRCSSSASPAPTAAATASSASWCTP